MTDMPFEVSVSVQVPEAATLEDFQRQVFDVTEAHWPAPHSWGAWVFDLPFVMDLDWTVAGNPAAPLGELFERFDVVTVSVRRADDVTGADS